MFRSLKTPATFALLIAALAFVAAPLTAQVEVDERLPEYEAAQGVSGTVKSVGSDTLNNLMTLWAEKFKESTRTSRSRSRARVPPPRRRP